ncbi:hypothetical protein LCGC14_1732880, partial [marine sediment metagenome]
MANFGDCLQLNGTSDYVNLSAVVTAVPLSICVWFNLPNITLSQTPLSIVDASTLASFRIRVKGSDDLVYAVAVDTSPQSSSAVTTTTYTPNTWQHVCAVFATNADRRVYLDGGNKGTNTDSRTPTGLDVTNIGRLGGSSADEYANGTLDEVMVFSVALTDAQVLDIYNNQSARFVGTGKQELSDQTYLDISSGNNRVNVTTTFDNNFESNVSLFLQYFNATGWFSTSAQNLTSGQNSTFTIDSTSTNLTLNYSLIAGPNQTSTFYTPLVYGDIILDVYTEVTDSTPPNVTINQPTNITYSTSSIDFNVTALDETSMTDGSCWASIDAGVTNLTLQNTTNNDDYNATNTTIPDGGYQAQFWCNDTQNNINNTETQDFTIDSIYPQINFTLPPTPSNDTTTSNTSIEINVSITEANLNEVKFNWNGTNYTIFNDSVVLFMNFDNRSALGENDTHVFDISGTGNNGTVNGTSVMNLTGGKYHGAFEFDGINDYINMGSDASLDNIFAGGGTISAWFYAKSYGELSFGRIFFKGSDASNTASTQLYLQNSSGLEKRLKLYRSFDGANGQWHIGDINLNTWYHAVVVYNEDSVNNIPVFYLNGVSQSVTEQINSSGSSVSDAANNLHIGSRVSDREFNGTIDEAMIFNRILSANEIQQLYFTNLYKYNSTQWNLYVNQSKNNTDGLVEGIYTYFASAKDDIGNENLTEERTITISTADSTFPEITITNPINNSNQSSTTFDLNYTYIEANPDSCWYSNNSGTTNSSIVSMGT